MPTLDTRDLDKRLDELEDMRTAYLDSIGSSMEEADLTSEEYEELEELEILRNDVSEWSDGNQLIPEDEFEEYAEELAYSIGAMPGNTPNDLAWPLTCIDWEKAADELREDYSEVEYKGKTYLVRD